jgi:hypothetical protein
MFNVHVRLVQGNQAYTLTIEDKIKKSEHTT